MIIWLLMQTDVSKLFTYMIKLGENFNFETWAITLALCYCWLKLKTCFLWETSPQVEGCMGGISFKTTTRPDPSFPSHLIVGTHISALPLIEVTVCSEFNHLFLLHLVDFIQVSPATACPFYLPRVWVKYQSLLASRSKSQALKVVLLKTLSLGMQWRENTLFLSAVEGEGQRRKSHSSPKLSPKKSSWAWGGCWAQDFKTSFKHPFWTT